MKQHFTKAEKEAYRQEQARIKAAHERFDSFMSEHGWTKYHLFMRGSKWVKGDDTIIYDRNGWKLNEQTVTEQEIHKFLQYD
jgi:hypothetical protein